MPTKKKKKTKVRKKTSKKVRRKTKVRKKTSKKVRKKTKVEKKLKLKNKLQILQKNLLLKLDLNGLKVA